MVRAQVKAETRKSKKEASLMAHIQARSQRISKKITFCHDLWKSAKD